MERTRDEVVRLLHEGRLLGLPAGPRFVSADRGELWVVGTLTVSGTDASFTRLDTILPASAPPTTAPDRWPVFY